MLEALEIVQHPTPTTTTTTGSSMPSITAMDVLGLAMNPALGITNLGA
jgi:hypothetical protein